MLANLLWTISALSMCEFAASVHVVVVGFARNTFVYNNHISIE